MYQVPPELANSDAAALMCGGATVFNCLAMFDVRPTDRVGVVGLGGLGHLAVQFARKWGCEVVVFSGEEAKREEAGRLGASEFYATRGVETFPDGMAQINHLLVTTSVQVSWPLFLPIMAPLGTVYPLTIVGEEELKIPYMMILQGGVRVQGSIVASRVLVRQMLAFAARHGVRAVTQEYRLDERGIEEAMQHLREGKMRYKAVLKAEE